MKLRSKIIGLYVAMLSMSSFAQDIHFSQLEQSPLTLNPAMAGANSPIQAIINYRNQWSKVGVPYSTIAASYDMRTNDSYYMKEGNFAFGINFFNDQAGAQRMATTIANLNLAYHLLVTNESTLGLGIYGGYGQRSFNDDGAQWMSQYDGFGWNGNVNSGEAFERPSFNYFDAGAGIVYTYLVDGGYMTQNLKKVVNVGFSACHLNRPKYSFMKLDNERLAIRYAAFVHADLGIENSRMRIQPGLFYLRQAGHQEIMAGTNFGYIIHEGSRSTGFTRPITFYTGIFYRHKDAMIGRMAFEYDVFSLGFAYDMNISDLATVSKTIGGFEFFLRYSMGDGGGFRMGKKINRVRF